MNPTGDAATEVVQLYLKGLEVAVKITGKVGAAPIRLIQMLVAMKNKGNPKLRGSGEAKLAKLLREGNIVNFTIKREDLETFTAKAKKWSIRYNILDTGEAEVDIAVREMDAARANRLIEKYLSGGAISVAKVEVERTTTDIDRDINAQNEIIADALAAEARQAESEQSAETAAADPTQRGVENDDGRSETTSQSVHEKSERRSVKKDLADAAKKEQKTEPQKAEKNAPKKTKSKKRNKSKKGKVR